MSVVGAFFILITIAVGYIIHRKRSERGKDKLILRTLIDAFLFMCKCHTQNYPLIIIICRS